MFIVYSKVLQSLSITMKNFEENFQLWSTLGHSGGGPELWQLWAKKFFADEGLSRGTHHRSPGARATSHPILWHQLHLQLDRKHAYTLRFPTLVCIGIECR
jgi:hypothetical protein